LGATTAAGLPSSALYGQDPIGRGAQAVAPGGRSAPFLP